MSPMAPLASSRIFRSSRPAWVLAPERRGFLYAGLALASLLLMAASAAIAAAI